MVVSFPFDVYNQVKQYQEEKVEQERQKVLEQEEAELERQIAEEPKKPRKRKTFSVPEKTKEELEAAQAKWGRDQAEEAQAKGAEKTAPIITGGLWTDEDINELVKLCSKYPGKGFTTCITKINVLSQIVADSISILGGTPARWETIASFLNRPVTEVTFMAKKVFGS
jgi:DnaJ family protein C protein 1